MKKIVAFVFVVFVSTSGFAQQFNAGINTNFIFWDVVSPTNEGKANFPDWVYKEDNFLVFGLQATVGFYMPLLFMKDNKMSIGPHLNLAGGWLKNDKLNISGAWLIDFPQYLMFRYGNGSTKDNKKGFGFGVGLGYNQEWIPFPLGTSNACFDVYLGEQTALRLSFDLVKRTLYDYYSSEGLKPTLEYRNITLQITSRL